MTLMQKFDEVSQRPEAAEMHGIGPLTEEEQQVFDEVVMDTARKEVRKEELLNNLGARPVARLVEVSGLAVEPDDVKKALDEGQDVIAHNSAGRQS